jgi:hypothetical protein
MFDSLIDFLKDLLSSLVEYLKETAIWIIEWIKEVALSVLTPVLQGIGNMIPDGWNENIEEGLSWLCYIDSWVPIVFAVQMFIAYLAITKSLNVLKWILKAIPTVWG